MPALTPAYASPLGLYRRPHSPAEHFARIGYDLLAAEIPDAAYRYSSDPWPTDDEDDDRGAKARWTDRRLLKMLIGDEPAAKRRRAVKKKPSLMDIVQTWGEMLEEEGFGPATAKESPGELAGRRIAWHLRLPGLKVWAGQATIDTMIDGRRAALATADLPDDVRLAEWAVPYPSLSGLDSRSAATVLDIGFSPDAARIQTHSYLAAELLAVLGMEVSPITCYSYTEYGYTDPDGGRWRFSVVERTGYHRMLTTSCRA